MSIIATIVGFFVSAFALKLALGALGQPARQNKYGTALTVAFVLSLVGFVTGFVPFFGWLVYGIAWLAIVKSVYRLSLTRSMMVAIVQVAIRVVLMLLLGFILP